MAEKSTKSTKAPAKDMSLEQQVAAKRQELLTAKSSLYDGTLQNPHAIKAIKKDLARLLTKINKKEIK